MRARAGEVLRLHLINLNEVITPCFLRKAPRFTVEQGIRNRGVTCCRYIVRGALLQLGYITVGEN